MMPVEVRKQLVDKQDTTLSVSMQCQILQLPRSTFYYTAKGISEQDLAMMRLLDLSYIENPTYGVRRMCSRLREHGFEVGKDKTRSLMQRMRMKTIYCRPRMTCIDKTSYKFPYLLRNLEISRCNQVWALDITYIPMERGYMYLVAIMDVFSRYIVGWSISNTMESEWVVKTLKAAVAKHGTPEIINSDQGSQFTSELYVAYVKSLNHTQISMDGKGRAIDNVYIERFWRTIKYEKLYLQVPANGHEVERDCGAFIIEYNDYRKHTATGRTPAGLYFNRPDNLSLIPTLQWSAISPGPKNGARKYLTCKVGNNSFVNL